jgi:hypothetical protein
MGLWIKRYQEYLVALGGVIATAVLAKLPNKLGGTILCPTSDPFCEWGWTVATLVFTPLLIIATWNISKKTVAVIWNYTTWKVKVWMARPKRIRGWFELHKPNELKLYIHNPPSAKSTDFECSFEKYTDIRGRSYLSDLGYRHELHLARESYGTFPVFNDTLLPNDTRVIDISISYKGTFALRMSDTYVFGFRDGIFEYIISGKVKYSDRPYLHLSKFISVWLIIKNGVLVEIKDEL